jgi:DNA-binding beta-propeller fold protein YncE
VQLRTVQPGGMAFAGGSLWVGDDTAGNSQLLRVDPATRKVTRVHAGGGRPAYLTTAAGALWVSNVDDGSVSSINPRTGRVNATLNVGVSPVNLKGRASQPPEVWVPDDNGNQVIRIDATTPRVVEHIPTAGGPAVVRAVGGDVWVTMFGIGEVWRIHPAG